MDAGPSGSSSSRTPPIQVPPCLHNRVGSTSRPAAPDEQQGRRTRQRLETLPPLPCYANASVAAWWWRQQYNSLTQPRPSSPPLLSQQQQEQQQQAPVASSSSEVVMDWRLWSELPDDLIEKILSWLPVPAFFRFRSVCRRWRSIMYTRGFADMCAQVPASTRGAPFFLKVARCRCRMLSAYYPPANRWLSIPTSFLPSQVSVPAASSRGLMCFVATQFVDGYSVLLVCNPLTRCWKALPPMTTRRYPFVVSLVTDSKLRTYKVVVVGDYNSPDNRRTTEVYDSATSTWKQSGPLPVQEEVTKNMVTCNGYLFCLSRGPGNGLLAYSLSQEVWIKVRTGRMPGYSKFRHLIECNGRIIIIGKALRRQVLGLYIWHLDPATMKWRELARMPQLLSEQFFRTPSECFFCAAHGDQIFISRFFCERGLLYNITHDTWQLITDCPKIANPFILTLEPGFDAGT